MLNLYIYKKVEGLQHIPLLNYFWEQNNMGVKRFGDKALSLFNKQFFNLVEDPRTADYFLIPHNFFYIKNQDYLEHFVSLSKEHNKKVIIFSYGDSDEEITLPNSIIFRTSQYAYKKKNNEIIMPAIADDLLEGDLIIRLKQEKAVIGFCGWASFENFSRALVENIKVILLVLKAVFDTNMQFHKRGIIFRIEALKALDHSKKISTNFVIRKSFSGNEKTIKMDAELSRKEYIENILNSDLSLAVKGDGNFSIRFYEILSLGRIPLFINTNCILPLEETINYDSFIFKARSDNFKDLGDKVYEFYKKLSDMEFQEMQKKARSTFETYLRADKYFEHVLNHDFLKKYE